MTTLKETAPDSGLGVVDLTDMVRVYPEDLAALRAQEAVHAELAAVLCPADS